MATFLDLQKDLALYLREPHDDTSGYWDQEIKKRKINEGLRAVVARTNCLPKTVTLDTLDGISIIPIPEDLLKPRILFINGKRYYPSTEEDKLKGHGFDLNTTYPQSGKRIYIWYRGNKSVDVRPIPSTAQSTAGIGKCVLAYIQRPKLLINDPDIPEFAEEYHRLASLWAGWQLLYKDKERSSEGEACKIDFENGISDLDADLGEETDGLRRYMMLDPRIFKEMDLNHIRVDDSELFDLAE